MSPTADMMRIITPIVVLTSHMLRRLKCVRTALTKNVMRNHQSIAPPKMKRYSEEQNERIGEAEQKTGDGVLCVGVFLLLRRSQRAGRIFANKINAIANKNQAANDLQNVLIGLDEIDDYRHAQTGEHTIEHIGERSPQTGKEPRPTPFVESALNTQNTDRTHRRRNEHSYG